MKHLTLRLNDSELHVLRMYSASRRMSMSAVIMHALDSHVPGFREKAASKQDAQSPSAPANIEVNDLVFEED